MLLALRPRLCPASTGGASGVINSRIDDLQLNVTFTSVAPSATPTTVSADAATATDAATVAPASADAGAPHPDAAVVAPSDASAVAAGLNGDPVEPAHPTPTDPPKTEG